MTVEDLSDTELRALLLQRGISTETADKLVEKRKEPDVARLLDDYLSNRDWDG